MRTCLKKIKHAYDSCAKRARYATVGTCDAKTHHLNE